MNHEAITAIVAANGYGVGIHPNPFAEQCKEWARRNVLSGERARLTAKIESLFEPRFITPPETSEFIEALVTMTDARQILEIGTCTGFTTLHLLRAVWGKDGAQVVSVDARPAHDAAWFEQLGPIFQHIEGWTPGCLGQLHGRVFDLVFIDSDHSVEHCDKELEALLPITRSGTVFLFHDVPQWQTPQNRTPPPVREWLDEMVRRGVLRGTVLPTAEQLDCLDTWGPGYPQECNPHLGVFVRC